MELIRVRVIALALSLAFIAQLTLQLFLLHVEEVGRTEEVGLGRSAEVLVHRLNRTRTPLIQ